ncbi:MAG: L-serine ammonia-lyase [Pseudodesulfovibrio sp.]|uniref:L-serine dehydratase n=1 Tax=Pseudodesulfovibrio aespoeensis (strain ATCC 700646 / DSM 10631 / Aspo-2) TaxID=643562 RepID=E6VZT4_PSEA9|nr:MULTISPECIES: L-serine ammonia-lyase [Pseudodesulfovibrio]MBU4242874.1 L-serine ammonia-lyase [Pseudomonadota bacterium]ADU62912.1 L-serine ammonia-lyase [Pseudodesulfovibrio aespoeensis Aspo-2]MBU4380554.1 L-serine ammonia-lyase [Pseudomonadota bacterium]MBU4474244.1 L-serine ammonia-lyase [Pseudomonadota bacterium]MBU4514634.1 L-serine ammonia-lyase [Pseudomonadota bacterium]
MPAISTSIFELLKIGPGPSSSHTIGPMRAGFDFMESVRQLPDADRQRAGTVEIRLFGSLSATGNGHGTPRAIMAGLLGHEPDTCLPNVLEEFDDSQRPFDLDLGGKTLPYHTRDIIFDAVQHDYPHSNTMIFRLLNGAEVVFERIFFSVGGGFLRWPGWEEPKRGLPAYPYETMTQLKTHLRAHSMRLHELLLANEQAITGMTEEQIYAGLDRITEVMEGAVECGIVTEGVLPGTIGLQRKAPVMYNRAKSEYFQGSGFLKAVNAYALAASEENAAGHCVVTAPTCGGAGVLPAILHTLKRHMGATQEEIRQGLLVAACIGFLAKHNASISGAEVGCQGEVGVASAMAAAFLAYARGYRFQVTENAAEIAMEHHLGLTCDPVGGYVQIPCIERNAMGAVKAFNAYLIASTLDESYQKVDLDKVIQAMAQTGHDMSRKYKETSLAGLAMSMTEC